MHEKQSTLHFKHSFQLPLYTKLGLTMPYCTIGFARRFTVSSQCPLFHQLHSDKAAAGRNLPLSFQPVTLGTDAQLMRIQPGDFLPVRDYGERQRPSLLPWVFFTEKDSYCHNIPASSCSILHSLISSCVISRHQSRYISAGSLTSSLGNHFML